MKNIILTVVFMIVASAAFAQTPILFSQVVEIKGVSQRELHDRADSWLVSLYHDSKEVLQLDQDGHIMGRAKMSYYPIAKKTRKIFKGDIYYAIHIYLKDGRYKCEITDFNHESDVGGFDFYILTDQEITPITPPFGYSRKWSQPTFEDVKLESKNYAISLLASLNKAMVKEAKNW